MIGSDSCVEFAEIAMQRGHSVVACDNQSLPFRESCFDAVISVGVIHHFASGKRRSKALEELYRILRPGGRMLVYVWAFEQEQRKVCNWGEGGGSKVCIKFGAIVICGTYKADPMHKAEWLVC